MELVLGEWEVACCVELPRPGAPWSAALVVYRSTEVVPADDDAPDGLRNHDGAGPIVIATGRLVGAEGAYVRLDVGGIAVFVDRYVAPDAPILEPPDAARLTVTGRLGTYFHTDPDEMPPTDVVVHRVRWMRQQLRQTGPRDYEFVGWDPPVDLDTVPAGQRGDGDYLIEFELA